jgi:arylsulfatase A-like enzyme
MIMNKTLLTLRIAACLLTVTPCAHAEKSKISSSDSRPNIIFIVADDMGYRDTGYSGNTIVKTPHLDEMAANGLDFEYFYSAHGTCSPGRMSILTGRTPLRSRMTTTVGPMRTGEVTVAAALKTAGYETGHFGKWGVGTRGTHPLKAGFDEAVWNKGFYDNGVAFFVNDSDKRDERPIQTEGESSIATVDEALKFIEKRAKRKQPFFAQISFGSPHGPHIATEEFKNLYPDLPEKEQHLWGEISGLDAAVGKLRRALRDLEIAENTLLWFVSDNGGITKTSGIERKGKIGGRTIGLLEWPAKIPEARKTDVAVCHIDMYPTVLDIVGITIEQQPVLDGISILPLIEGKMENRPQPLGFASGHFAERGDRESGCEFSNVVWLDGPHMLQIYPVNRRREHASLRLFDIIADPMQEKDLAGEQSDKVRAMRKELDKWMASVKASFEGSDYRQ